MVELILISQEMDQGAGFLVVDLEEYLGLSKHRMKKSGFSSPKPGTQNITMYEIARQHKLKLPKKRDDTEPILVRALAIERIKQLDKNAVDNYTDLQNNSSE